MTGAKESAATPATGSSWRYQDSPTPHFAAEPPRSPQPCSPQQVSKPKLALEHRLGAEVEKNRHQEAADREQHDEAAQGRAPGQGRSTASTRSFRSFTPGVGSGPEVLELRSITLGDRQCRSYFIAYDKGVACSTRDRSEPAAVFVLIHGIGMSHRYFRRLGAVLAAHGDVHLIDLRDTAGREDRTMPRVTRQRQT
ncbi:hypothetical protein ACFOD8_15770 [Arthrobacter agilis]|uniref:hypothetical protein n=1 Tax=Arthrobacter agilis TaxID=37921 RepID=UPI00361AFE82